MKLRPVMAILGIVLLGSGVLEFPGSPSAASWQDWAYAALGVGSGLALLVGAWRSDEASIARLFGRKPR